MQNISIPVFFRSLSVAVLCLVIVASIRFNRNDSIVSRSLSDAAFYISNVEKMRGYDTTTYKYKGPFNERIAVTTLAAFLPFSPLTSINLINLAFLLIGLYYLKMLLKVAGLSERFVWIGLYLFIFSFPTFYYSTIGYIDPSVLAAIFCGTYALYSNRPILFLAAIIVGSFSKENIIILVPVALAYAYSNRSIRWLWIALFSGLLIISINIIMRLHFAEINKYVLFWEPELGRIISNLTRPNFVISTLLSWGIPLMIGIYYIVYNYRKIIASWKQDLPLWVGIIFILITSLYMLIAAFPDGRNVWVSYCFPILLSMKWWQRFENNKRSPP